MDTHYADTTVVYYKLHGHSLQKQAVKDAVGQGTLAVSNFVRGEYIRGYVTGLIELYFAVKAEQSVQDGIHVFNGEMGTRHPRKVQNALQTAANWIGGLQDSQDVKKTLRRLGEHVRGTLAWFDMTFPRRARDPLECEIGVMAFPSETYEEKHLLDFYEEYEAIRKAPNCNQCDFRRDEKARLNAAGIDLYSTDQQRTYAGHRGYLKQAAVVDQAVRSRKTTPSCWYCDRLGDTIIALCAPEGLSIVTGDGQSFPALAGVLGKPLVLIPSLDELRARRDRTAGSRG
jgi:hypothetical protein